MTRAAQDMPPELFQRLVDEAAEADARDALDFVALHWFGEPLLHPDLLDLIAYAGEKLPNLRRRGALRNAVRGLCLSTNATLLTEERARGLLASPLTWLAVSVDGSSPETYADLRGGDFERVLANVDTLLRLNREQPRELPTVALQVIVTKTTEPELAACLARWEGHLATAPNVRFERKPYNDWAGQIVAPDLHAPDPRPSFFYLNCGYLWDTQVVGAGGEVGLCCYDVNARHGLGNADVSSLADLWRSPALNELRRLQARGQPGDLPLCANCAMGRKYPGDYLGRRRTGA